MPSPLGNKISELRKKKGLSLDDLATKTQSSKSYIWELENKDDPRPSAEKLNKIAAELGVTADYLMSADTAPPDQEVLDQVFFRKYQSMPDDTKKRLRQIVDAWDKDE